MNKVEQFYKSHPEYKRVADPEMSQRILERSLKDDEETDNWTEEQWQAWKKEFDEEQRQNAVRIVRDYEAGNLTPAMETEQYARNIQYMKKKI